MEDYVPSEEGGTKDITTITPRVLAESESSEKVEVLRLTTLQFDQKTATTGEETSRKDWGAQYLR